MTETSRENQLSEKNGATIIAPQKTTHLDAKDLLESIDVGLALALLQPRYIPKPCPECKLVGNRRGRCERGGLLVQRLECPLHGYYFDPDTANDKNEKLRAAMNEYLFKGHSQKSQAADLNKSSKTILRGMDRLRETCLDDFGIINRFHPQWYDATTSGDLVLDASQLLGTNYMMHVAFDYKTYDAVCYWLYETEDFSTWTDFFRRLGRTGYNARLFISDKGPLGCLKQAIHQHYPNVPHQIDWVHELDDVKSIIPPRPPQRARKDVTYQTPDERRLYARIFQMSKAPTRSECELIWSEILAEDWERTTTKRGVEVIDLLVKDYKN